MAKKKKKFVLNKKSGKIISSKFLKPRPVYKQGNSSFSEEKDKKVIYAKKFSEQIKKAVS